MRRSFKYRIYPTKAQKIKLDQTLDLCRFLYNCALEERIILYKRYGISVSYKDQANDLSAIVEQLPEYKEVFSQVRQDVLKRLDKAYQNFFRRVKQKGEKAGFPRFRGKHRYDSFTYPQAGFELKENRVYLSKIGSVKIKVHRPVQGKIKTCSVKRELDQWFVIFSCDIENDVQHEINLDNDIGIDVGITTFAVTSDEEYIPNPKFLKKSQDKLAAEQQKLSRKNRGSSRRNKHRIRVAKIHRKVKRQREDYQHKVSHMLINKYDVVYMEDLSIKNMVKDRRFSYGISDVAWGQFASMLVYKAEEAGKRVIFVNPKGTTQRCSQCGETVHKEIQDRWHCCPHCGFEANRDFNAALEIKRLGRSLHREETGSVESK